jgi:hypothetical protein
MIISQAAACIEAIICEVPGPIAGAGLPGLIVRGDDDPLAAETQVTPEEQRVNELLG